MIMKNKRGDISTFVLVIGVFLVCAVTIFSFMFFHSTDRESIQDSLEAMAKINFLEDQIRLYENLGLQPESFLNIKKENGSYLVNVSVIDDEERMFYVEHDFAAKTAPNTAQ